MNFFLKIFFILSVITLINASSHRLQIHRQKSPFKTIGNILAEEKYFAKKHKLQLNENLNCANIDTQNSTFYSYIFIGTPPQQVKVKFDTSLYIVAIPSSQYLANLSKTSFVEYSSYELYFELGHEYPNNLLDDVRDVVQVSDLVIAGQLIYTTNVVEHGLFGLGSNTPGNTMFPSPMENLYNQKVLPQNIFSMYLVAESEDAVPEYGGEIIFGASDPSLYIGELTYVDVNTDFVYNWVINLDAVTLLGKTISKNVNALIDSGTDFIGCPILQYALINEKLNGTVDQLGHYIVDCDTIDTLPNVEFTIGGQIVTLNPTKYIIKLFGTAGKIECMSPFFYTEADYFILGTTFMTQQYFEFDSTNNRIGFAPAAPYNGSTNVIPIVPQNILPKRVCKST